MKPSPELVERLTKVALDKGLLIEAGWVGFQLAALPESAPEMQREQMRSAFFAGAQHLFASVMAVLDPGADPTEADLRRMAMIQSELDAFIEQFKRKHGL